MWLTTDGERPLTQGEWACMRLALRTLSAYIEDFFDAEDMDISETGIALFDRQTSSQKLALLAQIGTAMGEANAPSMRKTAIVDAAVSALLQTFWSELEMENALSEDDQLPVCEVRRLMLDAFENEEIDAELELPAPDSTDRGKWELLFMSFESRFLADYDFALESALDADPDRAADVRKILGIDHDYYVDTAPDPVDRDLNKYRQSLAKLFGEPMPNDDGKFIVTYDRYMGLTIGPCTDEQIEFLKANPWIEIAEQEFALYDCEFAVWKANFQNKLPTSAPGKELDSPEFIEQRAIRRRDALTSLGLPDCPF